MFFIDIIPTNIKLQSIKLPVVFISYKMYINKFIQLIYYFLQRLFKFL